MFHSILGQCATVCLKYAYLHVNQVLETMMQLLLLTIAVKPIQVQKQMVFLKMITIPFEISTQFLREQKTLRSD